MTLAYVCVLIAALLPYVLALSWRWPVYTPAANHAPRRFEETLSGWRQRAHWAHLNALEAFAPFAAAVIIASQLGAPPARLDVLALTFVGFRIGHGAFYVADLAVPRSLAFGGAFACVVAIFLSAL